MLDREYLKSMYPFGARMLQNYVSEACDKLEYRNSPMYDEYPDQLMINRLCDVICETVYSSEGEERIREIWNIKETENGLETEELPGSFRGSGGQIPPPPPWGQGNQAPPPPPPPPQGPGPSWMSDMIKILLLNEMFGRRCQRGICLY
jgi:hypothetical protein